MPTPTTDLQERLSQIARDSHARVDTREATADRVLRNLEAHERTGVPLSEESQSYLASYRHVVNTAAQDDALAGEPTSQEAREALRAMQNTGRVAPGQGPFLLPCPGHSFSIGDMVRLVPGGQPVACATSELLDAVGVVSATRPDAIEVSLFSQRNTALSAAYGRTVQQQASERLRLLRQQERARITTEAGLVSQEDAMRNVGIDMSAELSQLMARYAGMRPGELTAGAIGAIHTAPDVAKKPRRALYGAKPAENTRSRKIIRKKKT